MYKRRNLKEKVWNCLQSPIKVLKTAGQNRCVTFPPGVYLLTLKEIVKVRGYMFHYFFFFFAALDQYPQEIQRLAYWLATFQRNSYLIMLRLPSCSMKSIGSEAFHKYLDHVSLLSHHLKVFSSCLFHLGTRMFLAIQSILFTLIHCAS